MEHYRPRDHWLGAIVLALCILAPLTGMATGNGPESRAMTIWQDMETAVLRIERPGQPSRRLTVKVADEPGERRQGMQHLAPARVRAWPMWFVFPAPTETGWHMHGVRIGLDIAWVDAEGTVMEVARMTPDTVGYAADGPIRYALEMAAGQAAELGIRPGTTLTLVPEALR